MPWATVLMSSIRYRLIGSVNSMPRISRDSSIPARNRCRRLCRYCRLSRLATAARRPSASWTSRCMAPIRSICSSSVCARCSMRVSLRSSSCSVTSSRRVRSPRRSCSPSAMMTCAAVVVREMVLMTVRRPRSMRLAMATSPSRVSSGTVPISRQVHADRVVRLVNRTRRQIELDFFALLAAQLEQLRVAVLSLGIDDLDAGVTQRAEQIVELFGRGQLRGEHVVDLLVEQVTLLLAEGDELANLVVFFFD